MVCLHVGYHSALTRTVALSPPQRGWAWRTLCSVNKPDTEGQTDAYESTPMGTWRGQVHRDGEAAAGCQAGAGETVRECFLGTEFQSGKMMVVTAIQQCVWE